MSAERWTGQHTTQGFYDEALLRIILGIKWGGNQHLVFLKEEIHFCEVKQIFGLREHEFKRFKCSILLRSTRLIGTNNIF